MKTQPAIGLGMIFLILIGFSEHAISSEQTCNLEKYLAKTYFEKYDSLIDSEFSNFIANEIPLDLCKDQSFAVPRLSILHRDIIGEGSHRTLSSSFKFNVGSEFQSELSNRSCEIIFIERLPSGVFADSFELEHLVQRGVFADAAVFGDTNLELPSFRSNRSLVEIHTSIRTKLLSGGNDDLRFKIEVPLHARYQPLGVGFSRVEFGQPDLFMCCSSIEVNALNRSCLFMPTNKNSDGKVVWDMPCGNKDHTGVVSTLTFIFAIMAALLIVLASTRDSDSMVSSKSKHL